MRCRESQSRARATHASARRVRALAAETRAAWADTNLVFDAMRQQVEAVANAMRGEGIEREHAGAAIRAHIRVVLYDNGLREQEAETVVSHANDWVDFVYEAA
jgi:type IV pilus biogenesis protein CpaD/CtpE